VIKLEYIIKPTNKQMSQRKIDGYLKLCEIVRWGRSHPVKYCERFYGVEFLDSQKYAFMRTWTTQFNVWCQSRASGKTTLLAPFAMAKTNLVPNFQAYVMSGVGSQAQEMFTKLEKIAKREIASFTGLTDVFLNETVKSASNKDGFTHNPASFHFSLYNGSSLNSLNGAFDSNRSKRSNLNIYDESGFAPTELFETSMPFITQNSDFKLGGDIDISLEPLQFRNQAIFASSASSMDTYFYNAYKEYAKKMIQGDKNYFVIDINADIVMNATYNGKLYPVPLLTKEVIDDAMRKNKDKALREYFNKFSNEGGDGQIIKRASIIRNSELRKPILYNENKSQFVIAYDPARSFDNSVVVVGEEYLDPQVGWKMKIANVVSFSDIEKKNKTPIRTPEQIELIKQMLLDYNGKQVADYENIDALLIDSGSGGGGVLIADYFMEEWTDSSKVKHKGLIDRIESETYINKFPTAVNKLRLINPAKYKKLMYDALIEMIGLDLISFMDSYDNKGYIHINKLDENDEINTEIINLSTEEEWALVQSDLMKEELVNIHRFTSGTNYRYDLSPNKANTMNDDRAFCLAMLGWHLQQKRRTHLSKPKKIESNIEDLFLFKKPVTHKV
jgi:hypothetical protein